MATIFSHALVASSLGFALPLPGIKKDARFYTAAALCAMAPDADVIGFAFGISYGDFLGHRGFSHSLVFAFGLAVLATWQMHQSVRGRQRLLMVAFLTLATFSHGILDAFTNGGLGIALFSPFYNRRLFFPMTPIEVSPIGLAFFSPSGLQVILSEVVWIGLPCLWLIALAYLTSKLGGGTSSPTPP